MNMAKPWIFQLILSILIIMNTQACWSYQRRTETAPPSATYAVTSPPIHIVAPSTKPFMTFMGTVGTKYINATYNHTETILFNYENGIKVNLTCSGNDLNGILSKYHNDCLNISLSSSSPSYTHRFDMTLYSFDNETQWSCISANDINYNITVEFRLQQNNNSTNDFKYEDKKVAVNDQFPIECSHGGDKFIIVNNSNSFNKKHVMNKYYLFNITKDSFENTIFCMSFMNETSSTHRIIDNFIRFTKNEDGNRHEDQKQGYSNKLSVIKLAAIIVISCVVLMVIVSFIITRRRRRRFSEIQNATHSSETAYELSLSPINRSNMKKNVINTPPQNVEYAELQLEELGSTAGNERWRADTENITYSEIIGTIIKD